MTESNVVYKEGQSGSLLEKVHWAVCNFNIMLQAPSTMGRLLKDSRLKIDIQMTTAVCISIYKRLALQCWINI